MSDEVTEAELEAPADDAEVEEAQEYQLPPRDPVYDVVDELTDEMVAELADRLDGVKRLSLTAAERATVGNALVAAVARAKGPREKRAKRAAYDVPVGLAEKQ